MAHKRKDITDDTVKDGTDSAAFLISKLGMITARGFRAAIADHDLTPPLFHVLNIVNSLEGRSQQAIAEQMYAPKSRMVGFVDELENRGLIERRPDPDDRRVRGLFLTPAGRKLLNECRATALAFETKVCGSLDAGERKELLRLLNKLIDPIELAPGVHPALADDS